MAYTYDAKQLGAYLERLIREQVTASCWSWLQQQSDRYEKQYLPSYFNLSFTAISRFVPRKAVVLSAQDDEVLKSIRKDLTIQGWEIDRLCRAWWLLKLPATDEKTYTEQIENLFDAADVHELVAVYGALPLMAYPEQFRLRAAEGIRTSIGAVFEAVALNNPYPGEYLDEPAWNQLVLKAFFMEKPVQRIIGLEERANAELAHILSDYAHERWAAGRPVHPLLWWPVSRFIDEKIFPDIVRLFESEEPLQMKAAALACAASGFPAAKDLLHRHPVLQEKIAQGELTWENIVEPENK